MVLEAGAQGAGDFSPEERALLKNILGLRERRVEDVMVPRADIVAVPDDITVGALIRTFESATRNTLDVAAIPVLKMETHLPVIVDPSHAGGRADLVAPLAFAAIAAGADGLIVEVHPDPERALSDGDQSLTPSAFAELMTRLVPFAHAAGGTLRTPASRAQ